MFIYIFNFWPQMYKQTDRQTDLPWLFWTKCLENPVLQFKGTLPQDFLLPFGPLMLRLFYFRPILLQIHQNIGSATIIWLSTVYQTNNVRSLSNHSATYFILYNFLASCISLWNHHYSLCYQSSISICDNSLYWDGRDGFLEHT